MGVRPSAYFVFLFQFECFRKMGRGKFPDLNCPCQCCSFLFAQAMWTAMHTFREYKDTWEGIKTRGMKQDMSWNRAAVQYEQIFEWAMRDPPYA